MSCEKLVAFTLEQVYFPIDPRKHRNLNHPTPSLSSTGLTCYCFETKYQGVVMSRPHMYSSKIMEQSASVHFHELKLCSFSILYHININQRKYVKIDFKSNIDTTK